MNTRFKSRFIVGSVALAIGFLLFPGSVTAQNRSSISGFVFGPYRQPMSEIPVELLNEVNSIIQRVRTDGSGRFAFYGLSSGRFTIRALSMGRDLESRPEDIEIAGVGVSGRAIPEHVQRDIYMRPKKNEFAQAALTGVVFVQNVPEAAEIAYKRAIGDLDGGRAEVGEKGLVLAIELFPTYYLALERLGILKITNKQYEDAVTVMTKVISVNEKSFSGWYGLAHANHALKRYDDAIHAANKTIKLNSNSQEAFFLLGMSLRPQGKFVESEKAFLNVVKLTDGKDANAHWNLALLYAHNLKQFAKAADHLEKFLKVSADAPNKDSIKKLIKQFREKARST